MGLTFLAAGPNMGFANQILGGMGTLIRDAIHSQNYVPKVSGWTINKDGTAEFSGLTLRGSFIGVNWQLNSSGLFFYNADPLVGVTDELDAAILDESGAQLDNEGGAAIFMAIAPASGTDQFGNTYQAGITAGSPATGSVYIDLMGDINLAGADGAQNIQMSAQNQRILIYNDPAGAGNLALSIAIANGTDQYGNTYPAGVRIFTPAQTMPAMTNGWGIGGHAKYLLDPLGNLVVSFKDLTVGSVADGTTIWAAGSLPAAYAPPNNRRVVCFNDGIKTVGGNLEAPALEFETDGSVQCYGFAAGATRADLFATIPLGF